MCEGSESRGRHFLQVHTCLYADTQKNQKLFTFYVEKETLHKETLHPTITPPPQTCLKFVIQNKYFRYMVYFFN